MPQDVNVTTPEALGPISAPSIGDPRTSGGIRAIVQKLINMIAGALQTATPVGTVVAFAGASVPTGWLLCNGTAVSRSDYARLFALIGTDFGVGNNSSTFNLPDLRGRFPLGVGLGPNLTNRTRASTGGEELHALTIQEMPVHSHAAPTGTGGGSANYEVPVAGAYSGAYDYVQSAPTQTTGGDAGHNTMPPYLALNYIIRVG